MSKMNVDLNSRESMYKKIGWPGGTIACDNSIFGCKVRISTLDERQEHKDKCEFGPNQLIKCHQCGVESKRCEMKYHNCVRELKHILFETQEKFNTLLEKVAQNDKELVFIKGHIRRVLSTQSDIRETEEIEEEEERLSSQVDDLRVSESLIRRLENYQEHLQQEIINTKEESHKTIEQKLSCPQPPPRKLQLRTIDELDSKYGIDYSAGLKKSSEEAEQHSPIISPPIQKMTLKNFRRIFSVDPETDGKTSPEPKHSSPTYIHLPSPTENTTSPDIELSSESRMKINGFGNNEVDRRPIIVRVRSWSGRDHDHS